VRPVLPVHVASPFRPRENFLSGRPLRVIYESDVTVLLRTQTIGPSRIATVEWALLDTASHPQLTGGAARLVEAMAASSSTSGLRELSKQVGAGAAFRRIGSIAATLGLAVAKGLEPLTRRTLIELDRRARGEGGWVHTTWGVAWPDPPSELGAVVAS
jgi:predicted transcriptional regulator of viral defense system